MRWRWGSCRGEREALMVEEVLLGMVMRRIILLVGGEGVVLDVAGQLTVVNVVVVEAVPERWLRWW